MGAPAFLNCKAPVQSIRPAPTTDFLRKSGIVKKDPTSHCRLPAWAGGRLSVSELDAALLYSSASHSCATIRLCFMVAGSSRSVSVCACNHTFTASLAVYSICKFPGPKVTAHINDLWLNVSLFNSRAHVTQPRLIIATLCPERIGICMYAALAPRHHGACLPSRTSWNLPLSLGSLGE